MNFRSCKHKTYTFTSNKITMRNPNENDKELQDDNSITTYPDRSNILFMNILTIKLYRIQLKNQRKYINCLLKMINLNCYNRKPNHPCRILIMGGSGSGKASALLNLTNHSPT